MTTETLNRLQNQANRNAEDAHRNRRLDRDALIAAALQRLEASAIEIADSGPNRDVWIAFYAAFTGRNINPDDVSGLLAEIRAQLSPLVRE